MKLNTISYLACLAAAVSCTTSAQNAKCPASVVSVFADADETASADSPKAPLIAVPFDGNGQERILSDLIAAGALPSLIPSELTDFNLLRDYAASVDGFVITEGFSMELDAEVRDAGIHSEALLLLKAMMDRNVPIYGSSDLLSSINLSYKRIDEKYSSVEDFVSKASTYRRAKALMDRILSVDSHNDQPCEYDNGASVGLRKSNQVSIQKMTEGHLVSAVLVDYLGQGENDAESLAKAVSKCRGILKEIKEDVAKFSDFCGIATNEQEARALRTQGKNAFFIGIENAYGIGDDLSNIERYRREGVVYMTLCHMADNLVCHTSRAKSPNHHLGLTDFGYKVVEELNRCGMLVDLSHASEQTFWDVIKVSKAPIACTHSGAKALYGHDRNITDAQLKALAENGGVIQVYFVDNFLTADETKTSVYDMADHIDHCVSVAGIDHVGIGSDFDGGGGGWGFNGSNDAINLTVLLMERGYSNEDIEKLWGGNFMRVLSEVQTLGEI